MHWSTVGSATAADSEIMAFAAENDYVVRTHDLDFSAILAATHGERPRVVQLRTEDVSAQAIGTHVIAAVQHMKPELEAGALLTVDLLRTCVRLLPLRAEDES